MKTHIAVLFGGASSEYKVSLKSASAVIRHLNADKYEPLLIGITRQGAWFRYRGEVSRIEADTWQGEGCTPAIISPDRINRGLVEFTPVGAIVTSIDVAFPVLHGKNGEDGTLQGLLTLAGIPMVGCGVLSSALCMDKDIANTLAGAAGIEVPETLVLRRGEPLAPAVERGLRMDLPLFVKPANAGSSMGVSKVTEPGALKGAVLAAFQHDRKVLIQRAVEGFEVGCAVMGNEGLILGEVDEIELSGGFFDYTEKYGLITSRIHMPARVDAITARAVKAAAAKLYKALDCRGFARVDLFLTPGGSILFNEINTIPGLTDHSRFPGMLGGIGMSFGEIVENLIGLAMADG